MPAPRPSDGPDDPGRVRAFRDELRAWVGAHFRPGIGQVEWHDELVGGRWAVPAWPERFGGRAATPLQQVAYEEELASVGAPMVRNELALFQLGPALLACGTPEQQERYLPAMVTAEEIWCQGFSEPGAGSDLAGIACRAVDDGGDGWRVDGHKTWNTHGDEAAWCMALVRTADGARRHDGLSMLIVDMGAPGVEVRPVRDLTGGAAFNDVVFDGVSVPRSALVGEVGHGWDVAMRILELERFATVRVGIALEHAVREVAGMANERGLLADDEIRRRLVGLAVRVRLLVPAARHVAAAIEAGEDLGHVLVIGKLEASHLHQELAELACTVLGPDGALWGPGRDGWGHAILQSRMNTIAGGTTQIMRNVLAHRTLRLPRG